MSMDFSALAEKWGLSRIFKDPKAIAAILVLFVCSVWILVYAFSCGGRNQAARSRIIPTPAVSLVTAMQAAVPIEESDPERYNYIAIAVVLEPKPGVEPREDGVVDPDSMIEVIVIGGAAWNARNIQALRSTLQSVIDAAPPEQQAIEIRWEVTPESPF